MHDRYTLITSLFSEIQSYNGASVLKEKPCIHAEKSFYSLPWIKVITQRIDKFPENVCRCMYEYMWQYMSIRVYEYMCEHVCVLMFIKINDYSKMERIKFLTQLF